MGMGWDETDAGARKGARGEGVCGIKSTNMRTETILEECRHAS